MLKKYKYFFEKDKSAIERTLFSNFSDVGLTISWIRTPKRNKEEEKKRRNRKNKEMTREKEEVDMG
jgi:hypothetical protein